jgi:hypothetical protein
MITPIVTETHRHGDPVGARPNYLRSVPERLASEGIGTGGSQAPSAHASRSGSVAVQPRRTIRP